MPPKDPNNYLKTKFEHPAYFQKGVEERWEAHEDFHNENLEWAICEMEKWKASATQMLALLEKREKDLPSPVLKELLQALSDI